MHISQRTIWTLTLLTALAAFSAGAFDDLRRVNAQNDPPAGEGSSNATSGETKTEAATESEKQGTDNQGAGATPNEHPESYLDFAMAGGYLMIPLGVASLLWLTFLVERLVGLRRSGILPGNLVRSVNGLPAGPVDMSQVESICNANRSSAGRVLYAAATHIDQTRHEIEDAVNNAAQREIHSMKRYLRLFAIIAAVAPLLGLLGTVTGMIQAFREVAIAGLGSGKALAPGIYKALVTTATGLIVAIPALLTHSWIQSRIDNYVHSINTLVVDFVDKHRPAAASGSGASSSGGAAATASSAPVGAGSA